VSRATETLRVPKRGTQQASAAGLDEFCDEALRLWVFVVRSLALAEQSGNLVANPRDALLVRQHAPATRKRPQYCCDL
jgi:hypothetical protein